MSRPWLLDPLSAAQARPDTADDEVELRRRARDIYLAWLLHLPADVDPSLAATALLAHIESSAAANAADGEIAHLRALLEETMSWPREVLAAIPPVRSASAPSQGHDRQCGSSRRLRRKCG